MDAGFATNGTFSNLEAGRTYYFAATAYAAGDGTSPPLESPFSNEVSYVAPAPVAPVVNNAIALTVQASDSTAGPWVDLPVAWVLPSSGRKQVYRVLIEPTNQ
jgi:hypothetical protein